MSSIALILNLVAIAVLLIVWGLLWQALRRKQANREMAATCGAVTFIVAARILEPLVLKSTGLITWLDSSSRIPMWAILVFALVAATFEECGRVVGLSVGWRQKKDFAAWTLSFALGYAGAELFLIGVVGHGQLLFLATSIDGGTQALQAFPPEVQVVLQRSLAGLGATSALWLVSERLAAVAFQIAFTLLVASAIERASPGHFSLAFALHFLVDVPASAYQAGRLSLWLVELIYLSLGFVTAWQIRPHFSLRRYS